MRRPDGDGARERLRRLGLERATQRAGRPAAAGVVEAYVHVNWRIGALVELRCETDFVARDDGFRRLAREIAMHVTAMAPAYLAPADAPAAMPDEEKRRRVLLLQPYVRNERRTIQDLLTEQAARFRENVWVARFARFEIGG